MDDIGMAVANLSTTKIRALFTSIRSNIILAGRLVHFLSWDLFWVLNKNTPQDITVKRLSNFIALLNKSWSGSLAFIKLSLPSLLKRNCKIFAVFRYSKLHFQFYYLYYHMQISIHRLLLYFQPGCYTMSCFLICSYCQQLTSCFLISSYC